MTDRDPYSFGDHDLDPEQDQRDEFRLVGRARVNLELESAAPGDDSQARVVPADSSDVSSGGLRLVTQEPLRQGALLPANIELLGDGACCSLAVEVVWCRAIAGGVWQSGLKILDTGDGDYVAWMEVVARALEGE